MRATGVGAVVVIAAMCFVGCGSSTSAQSSVSGTASARLHQALLKTEATGTVHFDMTSAQSQQVPAGQPSQATVSTHFFGDEQFRGRRTIVTTINSASQPTSTVSVYVDGKRFDLFNTGRDTWTKYPTPQTYPFLAITQLSALAATEGHVTELGHASLAGVPTTEFRVSFPASATTGTTKPGSVGQEATAIHFAPSVLTAWIDSKGRVVRTDDKVTFTSTVDSRPTTVHTVANLSNFGAPVHIEAPSNFTVLSSPSS